MKSRLAPAILLFACLLGFSAYVLTSSAHLPSRVASHFDVHGHPDGWMSSSGHVRFMLAFGWGFPLFIIGIFFLTRYLPAGMVNIPNREYWLSPERRSATAEFLFRHSLWFGIVGVGFCAGLHFLVVQANQAAGGQLSNRLLLTLVGAFLVAIGIWVATMLRHFRLPRSAAGG